MSKRPPDTRSGISVVSSSAQTSAAVSHLVETNLRLVVRYAHRFQHCGVMLVDLIHAGNLGLVEAAHRFDASGGTTFVDFASWWVRQAMIHAIADRTGLHPMSSSVLATPTAAPIALTLPHEAADVTDSGDVAEIIDAIDNGLAEALDEGADLDETFHDIQLRASGSQRHAERLRGHLN